MTPSNPSNRRSRKPVAASPRPGPRSVRVAIIEDDAATRSALEQMLDAIPGCVCVASCRGQAAALKKLPALLPQVVLTDVQLQDGSGIDCVKSLAPALPDTSFVMLTIHHDGDTIFDALSAGAHGYLMKPVRVEQLREAIADVVGGGAPISGTVARRIIRAFQQPLAVPPPRPSPPDQQTPTMTLSGLAPKERTVLEHLATGAMYKEVAAEMGISMNTVLTYIRRIYGKLQVNSRHHAVEWYRRHR